jgi:hypothetical protein
VGGALPWHGTFFGKGRREDGETNAPKTEAYAGAAGFPRASRPSAQTTKSSSQQKRTSSCRPSTKFALSISCRPGQSERPGPNGRSNKGWDRRKGRARPADGATGGRLVPLPLPAGIPNVMRQSGRINTRDKDKNRNGLGPHHVHKSRMCPPRGDGHGRSAELPKNAGRLEAQLRAASGRSSKLLNDAEGIEAVVEVPGRGTLILSVQSRGGYSLRARTETQDRGQEGAVGNLVAVGVLGSEGVVSVVPG